MTRSSRDANQRARERHKPIDEAILDAATRRMADVGYSATSMRDIANDVGVTVGATYHHFDSKATILREIVERGYQEINSRLATVLEREELPDDALESVVRELVATMVSSFDFATVGRFDRRSIIESMGDRYRELRDTTTTLLDTPLRDGQRQQLLREDIDHHPASLIVSGMWNWLPDWWSPDRDDGSALAETFARIARYGVLGPAVIGDREHARATEPQQAAASVGPTDDRSRVTAVGPTSRREARLVEIREAAALGFADVGYSTAGLSDICRWTGIARGALYRYIGSKQNLLLSIMTHYLDEVADAVKAIEIDTPETALRTWAATVLTAQHERASHARVVLNEQRSLPADERDRIAIRLVSIDAIPRAIVPRLSGLREPPEFASNALLGMVHASYLWYREGEFSPGDVAEWVVELFLHGLSARQSPT